MTLILSTLILGGCVSPRPATPGYPRRVTLTQRSQTTLPGPIPRVRLEIDDITGGQVLLRMTRCGRTVVNLTSVSPGDVVPFRLAGHDYELKVVELRNLLTGDDFGVFEIDVPSVATNSPVDPIE